MTPHTPVPPAAGVSLKLEHLADLLAADPPPVAFVEIHAENYMVDGGPRLAALAEVRARLPLSLHGVGLSIGGAGPLDRAHLARLRSLADRFRPALFSEHLAWSTHEGAYHPDLLPLPYTAETLETVARHVAEAQAAVGMRLLLENPSSYLAFSESTMDETDFLAQVVERTGCGLLLDVNNVFVSARNLGTRPEAYLDAFPMEAVGEIHLAGHAEDGAAPGETLLIDTHDRPVADPVWALYARAVARAGRPVPTLVEWDADVPPFARLAAEAARAADAMAAALAPEPA